ncbi:MAG: hypothetical protein ACTSRZ_02740 [Promethearchaeota archaeon]
MQWNTTWGRTSGEGAMGICSDSQDNIYIAGFTDSFSVGEDDAFIVKKRVGNENTDDGCENPGVPGYRITGLIISILSGIALIIAIKKKRLSCGVN